MNGLKEKARKILEKVDPDKLRQEARELELEAGKPEFWRDNKEAAERMRRLAGLYEEIQRLETLEEWTRDETMDKGSGIKDRKKENGGEEIEKIINELEAKLYLSGPYDESSAIVSIHSGQGGVEAMDWAEMLYRMYRKYAENRRWNVEEVDYEPGSEAGIKTVIFEVTGESAYGYLKHEAGVHRLVRQSPFNADHLRQTSFALVEVMPVIDDQGNQGNKGMIKDEDLEWEFFRSGGHGGQNVNKVSSAVRLRHKPTGIAVSSQKERDQSRNREIALRVLRGKLLVLEGEKRREEEARLKGKHITPGWGNQIRSYVLSPYHLVKDLRTGYETTDSDAVLSGHLDGFIQAELHYLADGRD